MPNDLGDLAQPTAPSSSMWVPWESPDPPVISRVLRAAGSGRGLWGGCSKPQAESRCRGQQQECSSGFAGEVPGSPTLPGALQAAVRRLGGHS